MIRRPPRSTQSRSSAASDVYKRQIQPRMVKPPAREGEPPRQGEEGHTMVYSAVRDAAPQGAPAPPSHRAEAKPRGVADVAAIDEGDDAAGRRLGPVRRWRGGHLRGG